MGEFNDDRLLADAAEAEDEAAAADEEESWAATEAGNAVSVAVAFSDCQQILSFLYSPGSNGHSRTA